MKFIIIIYVLFVLVMNTEGQNFSPDYQNFLYMEIVNPDTVKNNSWFAIDKGQHFASSFIGTILLTKVNNRYLNIDKSNSKKIGISIILSVGLTKEVFDSQKVNNFFSWKDILANIAGVIAGIAILEIK